MSDKPSDAGTRMLFLFLALIVFAVIIIELQTGKASLKWGRSACFRDNQPFLYWSFVAFHFAIFVGMVFYALKDVLVVKNFLESYGTRAFLIKSAAGILFVFIMLSMISDFQKGAIGSVSRDIQPFVYWVIMLMKGFILGGCVREIFKR